MKIEVINEELVFGSESQDEFMLLTQLRAKLHASGANINSTQRCLSIKIYDEELHRDIDDPNYKQRNDINFIDGIVNVKFEV